MNHPKVFVSYAHDSEEHKSDVLKVAQLLVRSGVQVDLDRWAALRRQDWSSWMAHAVTTADFVLVIASRQYASVGDGHGQSGLHRGVRAEAALLRDLLHGDRAKWLPKILPVLLPGHEIDELPGFLQPATASHYRLTELSTAGIEELLRVITEQPRDVPPPLGPLPALPPQRGPVEADRVMRRPAVELHLLQGDAPKISMKRVSTLAEDLASLGRSRRLFSVAECLQVDWSDKGAWAHSLDSSDTCAGLAVGRDGRRSAWSGLTQGAAGFQLVEDDVFYRLTTMLEILLSLDLPANGVLAPVVNLEPLTLVRFGPPSIPFPATVPDRIFLPAEETMSLDELRESIPEVAEELTLRLIATFRRECR